MGAHILIVDDQEDIRLMLQRHYEPHYDVSTVCDADMALQFLSENRTEVVISDIQMPGKNGIELLREVKNNYPMVHVIMITAYITLDNALACMRYGADTCIFKPIQGFEELDRSVKEAVSHLAHWQQKFLELQEMKQGHKVSE